MNEAAGLRLVLPKLVELFPDAKIIVVNDCSIDDSSTACQDHGVREIVHLYSKDNGGGDKVRCPGREWRYTGLHAR